VPNGHDRVPDDRRLPPRLSFCRYAGRVQFGSNVPPGAIADAWSISCSRASTPRTSVGVRHRFEPRSRSSPTSAARRRPDRGNCSVVRPSRATAIRAAHTPRFRGRLRSAAASDSVLRSRPAPAGDRSRARVHRSITTRRPSSRPGSSPESTVREHRHRLHARPGRARDLATCDPDAVIAAPSRDRQEMSRLALPKSYSSIIRESEDLGPGSFDADGNDLAVWTRRLWFMGAMPIDRQGRDPASLGDDISRRRRESSTTDPTAAPRFAAQRSSCRSSYEEASSVPRRVGASARHRRRVSRPRLRLVDNGRRANAPGPVNLSERRPPHSLWSHPENTSDADYPA